MWTLLQADFLQHTLNQLKAQAASKEQLWFPELGKAFSLNYPAGEMPLLVKKGMEQVLCPTFRCCTTVPLFMAPALKGFDDSWEMPS